MDGRSSMECASLCGWAREAADLGQNTSFQMASTYMGLLHSSNQRGEMVSQLFKHLCKIP